MKTFLFALIGIVLGSVAFAWEPEHDVLLFERDANMPPTAPTPPPAPGTFLFISSEIGWDEKVVRGAPYSGEAVTERTQILMDANRIIQKDTARVYRDSEGRTRRDQELASIGTWASAGETPTLISIHDPLQKVSYILEPERKVARKLDGTLKPKITPAPSRPPKPPRMPAMPPSSPMHNEVHFYKRVQPENTEALGKQMMEGLVVEGTRSVSTIPAGEIGNEFPIRIVSEKWYSPDLQIYVLTRHKDPRFGETEYRVTNIRRGEPDASLFKVPPDYKIEKGPAPPDRVVIRKREAIND